jgi:PEP-CTERM motif-containing protein
VSASAGLLLGTVLFAGPAAADPVRITSGHLTAAGPHEFATFDFAGTDGFTFKGALSPIDGVLFPFIQCDVPECPPGTSINLLTNFSGSAFQGSVATLRGIEYTDIGSQVSGAFVSAFFELTGSAVAPAWANGQNATVSAPFLLTGQFQYLPDAFVTLAGSGVATVSLVPIVTGEGTWTVDSFRFAFEDSEPVPEPATLTLIGSGLAAAVAARRRRRSSRP